MVEALTPAASRAAVRALWCRPSSLFTVAGSTAASGTLPFRAPAPRARRSPSCRPATGKDHHPVRDLEPVPVDPLPVNRGDRRGGSHHRHLVLLVHVGHG